MIGEGGSVPTAVIDLPLTIDPPRKRWTRAEFESFPDWVLNGERLELVEGELISKMGKNRPHVNAQGLLHAWLLGIFGGRFVQSEAPIDVAPEDNPTSEPQPDLIVLGRDVSHFRLSNPGPADLRLVVEIADTTLSFDLTIKTRLYARAGIPEYWTLDVAGRRMIVHRDPQGGRYHSVVAYGEDEPITPLAAPDSKLLVRDVLLS
jgi:Uma2 family endonuclease